MSSLRTLRRFKIRAISDPTPQIRELELSCEEPTEFSFKAGQFVMLQIPQPEGKPALRAYSIASSDKSKAGFNLIFKFVENGVASKFIWSKNSGETLDFTGPFGKVFFQEPPTEQIVFLNTGSGVSQHLCYLLSKKDEYPNLKYKMLFGVRTEKDIYAEELLKSLKAQLPHFDYEFVLSRPSPEWKGKKGYVQDFIKEFNYLQVPTTFYLCGNGGMIKDVKSRLIDQEGFDKNRLWTEAFD